MKVLETNHPMSNAEVLHWIKQKRTQHEQEDKNSSSNTATRPQNYLDSLDKHERHLTSDAYPYIKNPNAYESTNQDTSIHKFGEAHMKKIQIPLVEKYKEEIRLGRKTPQQAQKELAGKQDEKELTEAEILMLFNHAPLCVEMMQPMIENVDERFSNEEQEALVECVREVFRVDEMRGTGQGMGVEDAEPMAMPKSDGGG